MAEIEAGPGSTISIGGPAAYEQRTEDPYSTDSSKSLSKPQLEQAAQSQALANDEITGTAGRAKYETDVAGIQANDAAAASKIKNQTVVERSAVDDAHTAQIAQRADDLRRANEEIRATPPPSLFADSKGWDTARRAIALSVAGLGEAISARANAVLGRANGPSAVKDIIDADLARQREIIGKLKDNQIMAKEGLKDAQAAREQALAKVDLKGAAMLGLAAAHTEELLKAKGVALPAVQQDEKVLTLRRAEQERKQAAVAGLTSEHTRVGAKSETTNRTVPDTSGGNGRLAVVKNADGTDAGLAPAAAAAKTNEATVLRIAAVRALNHYQEMAAKVGGRSLDPSSTEYQQLEQAHNGAIAAITSVTNMPGSDKSTEIEAKRLGPTGQGIAWKVNPTLIHNLAEDIRVQGESAIKMTANTAAMVSKAGDAKRPQLPASVTANPAPAVAPAQPATPVTPSMVPPAPAPTPPPAAPPAGGSVLKSQRQDALRWLVTEGKKPQNAAQAAAIREAYRIR